MAQPFYTLLGKVVQNGITDAFNAIKGDLNQIAKDGGEAANSGGFLDDIGNIGNFISGLANLASGILGDVPIVGGVLQDLFGAGEGLVDPIDALAQPAGKFGRGMGMGYALGYALWSLAQPLVLPIQHEINATIRSAIFDPQTAADLVARGLITLDFGRNESNGGNLDSTHFDSLVQAAALRPAVTEMLQMMNRGDIAPGDVQTGMTEEGITAFWQAPWMKLARQLLSPADIALAVLRGEIPQEQGLEYVTQLGLNADDFNTLVLNTGEPPGLEDMLFMYRRGIIDKPTLEHGIRESRVRDEWIAPVEAMRYVPMSTSDAVRAVVENYMTDTAGQAIAEQNGLEPTHWPYLREAWGRPLAHGEMADLVFRGQASRAQFDQAMRESDLKDKYIDQSFQIATRLLPIYQISSALKAGILSLENAAQQMLMQGYDQVAVSTILKYELRSTTTSTHELTKSEIVSLYADGGFTRDQSEKQLEAIGYAAAVANEILQVQDLKMHASEIKAELTVIRNNFISGAIDQVAANTEMKQLGISTDQINVNLETWTRARRRATKGLSEAQVVKAAKSGVYPPQQALNLLVGLGYAQADAVALLLSNDVSLTPPVAPPISGSDTGA